MDLVEPIPKRLEPHIRAELHPGELLIILLAADIRPDGQYGDSWFALTDERLLVFHPNGADKPQILQLNLSEVQKVQTRNYVGNGALVVELADETVELLRFSQSAYYKFSSVPQAIEAAGMKPGLSTEEIVVVGSNCMEEGIRNIRAGKQYSTNTQLPTENGKAAAEHIARYFNGEKLEKHEILKADVITQSNVNRYAESCTY